MWQLNSYNSIIVTKPLLLVSMYCVWELIYTLKIRIIFKHTIASAFTQLATYSKSLEQNKQTKKNSTYHHKYRWNIKKISLLDRWIFFSFPLPQLVFVKKKENEGHSEESNGACGGLTARHRPASSVLFSLDGSWLIGLSRFEPHKLVYLQSPDRQGLHLLYFFF